MITFKQFLEEAQNYPLYHGTDLSSLNWIIQFNEIRSGGYSDANLSHSQLAGKKTISFSRSKKFARYWGKRKDWARSYGTPDGVIIQVNREKLRNIHKVLPYNHFDQNARVSHTNRFASRAKNDYETLDQNQYEERVVGDINNAAKYIERIEISNSLKQIFKDRYPESYRIAVERGWL